MGSSSSPSHPIQRMRFHIFFSLFANVQKRDARMAWPLSFVFCLLWFCFSHSISLASWFRRVMLLVVRTMAMNSLWMTFVRTLFAVNVAVVFLFVLQFEYHLFSSHLCCYCACKPWHIISIFPDFLLCSVPLCSVFSCDCLRVSNVPKRQCFISSSCNFLTLETSEFAVCLCLFRV